MSIKVPSYRDIVDTAMENFNPKTDESETDDESEEGEGEGEEQDD